MQAFIRAKALLQGTGNLHGIVGKALTAASPFLIESNQTRRPYLPVPAATVVQFRRLAEEQFPDMIWKP